MTTTKASMKTTKQPRPGDADSTVGMTLYNCMCMYGKRPISTEKLLVAAASMQHASLRRPQVERVLAKLVELKRVKLEVVDGEDRYTTRANEPLFVCTRDMSDADPITLEGGWEGWCVKDPRIRDGVGSRPIEQLLGLPETGRKPRPLNLLKQQAAVAGGEV